MKNPFNQIATFQDYVDIIGIPKEQLQSEEAQNRINKWLVQATEQFDSMISGNGKLGRLYRWFNSLEDNEEDNYKKYKLIKALCSWVETFVIKGKFWVDGLPVINSNVDIQINSSSNDSNVEMKRKDIIQDLVSIGLYQTTNFGDSNTYEDNQQNANQLIEDLVVLSKNDLNNNYLMVNPQKPLQGNLDFANNDLVNGGNIIGSTQQARNNIKYYEIIDSTIDLSKNNVIGSLPLDPTQLEEIGDAFKDVYAQQEEQNASIEQNANNITTLQNDLGDLGNQVVDVQNKANANANEIARVDNVVNTNSTNIVNLDNKVNANTTNIQNNTNNIQTNTNNITSLDSRLVNVSSLLNQTIEGLKTLKPFQYVGEYQQGTSYSINQVVSLNNNLYLSKEDNNTTTPPSDKWLLLNEDFATIDLAQYYTKLEVNAIRDNLQNAINTNTTNITTIRNNYLDKTATGVQQIAAGSVYFNNQLVINQPYNPNLTPTANLHVIGQGFVENLDVDNASFTTSVIVPTPTQNDHAATKQYVDNSIITLGNSCVKTTGNQTIAGTKIFSNETKHNGGINAVSSSLSNGYVSTRRLELGYGSGVGYITPEDNTNKTLKFGSVSGKGRFTNIDLETNSRIINCPTPSSANDVANKSYVDTAVANSSNGSHRQVILTTTVYNNLQTLSINLSNYISTDSSKLWIIEFDRAGSNGSTYEGTFSYTFLMPSLNKATFAYSTTYFASGNKRFEQGAMAGIRILRDTDTTIQLMFQLWDSGNRITRVRLLAPN